MSIHFIETVVFTRRIIESELEPDLRRLQSELIVHPEAGDVERGSGGLRKVRMRDSSRNEGKRGGARVHYLYLPDHRVIYLIFVYAKDKQSKLTEPQKRQLKAVAESIRAEWDRRPRRTR